MFETIYKRYCIIYAQFSKQHNIASVQSNNNKIFSKSVSVQKNCFK